MTSVCLYLQVHQPYRLRPFSFFDIGGAQDYDDEEQNRTILNKVSDKCYLPANAALLALIKEHQGDFRFAFSLTGIILEQLEKCRPDVLASFQRLAETGCVEFLGETYFHSLAFLFDRQDFRAQVKLHQEKIRALFGRKPVTLRNTELIYSDALAEMAEKMGYQAVLAEGTDRLLGEHSPNFLYRPAGCDQIKLLLRNYRLSDDIAFRFSDKQWREHPLTAEKFARWLQQIQDNPAVVNLFLDYETFGEHQGQETGILEFLTALPKKILANPGFCFRTPAEITRIYDPIATLTVPEVSSWADRSRDVSAWLGNAMQRDASRTLYGLAGKVRRKQDPTLLHTWRKLQSADHFYYMSTKCWEDGAVHDYFNPYASPYDAYINYMNILDDFSRRVTRGGHKLTCNRKQSAGEAA